MSAPKTYAAYLRRATERQEQALTREQWNRRRERNRREAIRRLPEEITDDDGNPHWTEMSQEDWDELTLEAE